MAKGPKQLALLDALDKRFEQIAQNENRSDKINTLPTRHELGGVWNPYERPMFIMEKRAYEPWAYGGVDSEVIDDEIVVSVAACTGVTLWKSRLVILGEPRELALIDLHLDRATLGLNRARIRVGKGAKMTDERSVGFDVADVSVNTAIAAIGQVAGPLGIAIGTVKGLVEALIGLKKKDETALELSFGEILEWLLEQSTICINVVRVCMVSRLDWRPYVEALAYSDRRIRNIIDHWRDNWTHNGVSWPDKAGQSYDIKVHGQVDGRNRTIHFRVWFPLLMFDGTTFLLVCKTDNRRSGHDYHYIFALSGTTAGEHGKGDFSMLSCAVAGRDADGQWELGFPEAGPDRVELNPYRINDFFDSLQGHVKNELRPHPVSRDKVLMLMPQFRGMIGALRTTLTR